MTKAQMWRWMGVLLLGVLSGCSMSPQARRDKYLESGKAFAQKKDYPRAMLALRNAAQAMPKDAEPYYQMGLVALSSGDVRMGIYSLKRAIELNPKHTQAQLKIAELMAQGDENLVREAQTRVRGLMDTGPVTPEMLNTLAFTELRLGKTGDAVETLEGLLAKNPDELTSSVLLARAKLDARDSKGAEEVLQKAAATQPKSAEPHAVLGDFYRDTNRPNDAEKEFRAALRLDPNNVRALYSLAGVLYSLGRLQDAEATFQRLSAIRTSPYTYAYALFLLHQGRRDDALREFERLAHLDPDDRAARSRLVAAYELVGRDSDAAKLLSEALQRNAKDVEALVQRAQLSIRGRKFDDAARDLHTALQFQPDSASVHYFLGKVHQSRGQDRSYRQELSRAVQLDPLQMTARLELAQSLTAAQDAKGALDLLNSAPEPERKLPEFIVQRNWALWATGDMVEMRKGIDAGLALRRMPDLLVQDGLWKLRSGRNPAEARASLEEALQMNPQDVQALAALQQTYERQKQTAQAVEKVKQYASRQPRSAPVQEFLGTVLMNRGDHSGARAAFEAAKAADPHSERAEFSLIQLDVADGKLDNAVQKLQAVVTADPTNTRAHLWLSNLEISKGDRQKALAELRTVIAAEPDSPPALNNLAYLLSEDGNQLTEALKYAQRAKELAPDTPAYADTLGWIFYRQGVYASAVREFESAIAKGPNASWRYHLAMAYAKAGNTNQARATFAAAFKQNPNLPEARVAKQVLGAAALNGGGAQ